MQQTDSFSGQALDRLAVVVTELRQKALGQQRDILRTFAQGGQMNPQHRQTVVQVRTKFFFAHGLFQRDIGGTDNPDIHLARHLTANPYHLTIF